MAAGNQYDRQRAGPVARATTTRKCKDPNSRGADSGRLFGFRPIFVKSPSVMAGTNRASTLVIMTSLTTASYLTDERRHEPRIELLGEINGQVMPFALPVVLLDLSPGGFAIASSVPFTPDAEYTFQFNGVRPHGPIRAKDMHCLRVSHGTTSASYVAGFSFVFVMAADKDVVDDLIAEAHHLVTRAGSGQLATDAHNSYLNPAGPSQQASPN